MKLDPSDLSQIDAYLAAHREEMVQTLVTLSRIPSMKEEPEPDAPFGAACAEALKSVEALYRQNGFETKPAFEDGYALAYYGSGEKSIGVYAHADVVPVNPAEWTFCAPFEPRVTEEFVFGRGCSDNKSGVLASLYAAKMIRELALPFDGRLVLFTGSNEETGMKDIQAFAQKEPQPEVSIVPDGGYPFSYGERSILNFYLENKTAFIDTIEISGGSAANIVLDRATAVLHEKPGLLQALEALASSNARLAVSTRASGKEIVVEATGIASHAAHPETSLNAMLVLSEALSTCETLSAADRSIYVQTACLLADTRGETLGIAFSDDLGALTAANGIVYTKNGHMSLSFDVRFGMTKTCDELVDTVVHKTDAHWSICVEKKSAGFLLDPAGDTGKKLLEVYRSLSGDLNAAPFTMGGGTYARHLQNAYSVGTRAEYKRKLPEGMPEGHGGAHQADEHICIEALLESVKILTCMLVELA